MENSNGKIGNICEALTESVLRHPDSVAVEWKKDGRWIRVSYGELLGNIKTLSFALSDYYGIKQGDKGAILMANRLEWTVVFFALLFAGAIPVPVNTQESYPGIEAILADSECKIVFTEKPISFNGERTVSVNSHEFKNMLKPTPTLKENFPGMRGGENETACILYTTGTTGSPKGVMLSHGNLLSNYDSLVRLGLMKEGDGVVAVLLLYHAYALVVTMFSPLLGGGRVIFPGSVHSVEVITAIREANAALFIGVPLIFNAFHKAITDSLKKFPAILRFLLNITAECLYAVRRKTGLNLSRYFFYNIHRRFGPSMRVCLSGGTELKKNVERDLFKFGFTILNGYGLTETSPVLTVNPVKKPKIGSVGLPVRNVEIKIRDKDANGAGAILARGPNIMKGYYKNAALTRQVMEDGWFKTGDIGYKDRDGYLFFTGRSKDIIVLDLGLNLYPREIEDAYSAEAPVKEMCVFDAPSLKGIRDTTVLRAVVVPDMDFFKKKGITNPYNTIKAAFERVSRKMIIPERLMDFSLTLDALPCTVMGKVKRREVKRLYISGAFKEIFQPPEKHLKKEDLVTMRKPLARAIIDCIRTQTKVRGVTPGDSFELDLGIDLLGRGELASELERKIGLKIEEEAMNVIFTVEELIAYAEKKGKA